VGYDSYKMEKKKSVSNDLFLHGKLEKYLTPHYFIVFHNMTLVQNIHLTSVFNDG